MHCFCLHWCIPSKLGLFTREISLCVSVRVGMLTVTSTLATELIAMWTHWGGAQTKLWTQRRRVGHFIVSGTKILIPKQNVCQWRKLSPRWEEKEVEECMCVPPFSPFLTNNEPFHNKNYKKYAEAATNCCSTGSQRLDLMTSWERNMNAMNGFIKQHTHLNVYCETLQETSSLKRSC